MFDGLCDWRAGAGVTYESSELCLEQLFDLWRPVAIQSAKIIASEQTRFEWQWEEIPIITDSRTGVTYESIMIEHYLEQLSCDRIPGEIPAMSTAYSAGHHFSTTAVGENLPPKEFF